MHAQGHPTIAWGEIAGFEVTEVQGQQMLNIQVHDDDALLAKYSAVARTAVVTNRSVTGALVSLAEKNFGLSLEDLLAAIESRRQAFAGDIEN